MRSSKSTTPFVDLELISREGNQLAVKAISELLSNQLDTNIIYLYGATGVGKTHLLHTTIKEAKNLEYDPDSIMYLSSTDFIHQFMNALQKGTTQEYKNSLKQIKLLMIDNIESFAFKDRSQTEVLILIEDILLDENRKLIISTNNHPLHLVGVNAKIINRLSSGLCIEIKKPTIGEQTNFIDYYMSKYEIEMTQEAKDFINKQIKGNYFHLLGALRLSRLTFSERNNPITRHDLSYLLDIFEI